MNYFVWNIDPVIFSLGDLTLRWYGLLFVSGFIIGFYIMSWIFNREGKDTKDLDRWLFYIFGGAVIGARLGHCLFYEPAYYFANPIEILFIWKGGLASHGGGIGVLIGTYLFSAKRPETYLWLLDKLAIPTALAGAFIRLGNLFNSEIIGMPTDSMWGVIFARFDQMPRHPTQIYEAVSYLITFLLLLYIYKRYRSRVGEGIYLGIMLLFIFAARFFIEILKPEYAIYSLDINLNVGQLLSIPFIALGVVLIYRSVRRSD